jgi:hypothetical protein
MISILNRYCLKIDVNMATIYNQSTEGAEFVWVSECKKGTGCEIICIVPPMLSSGLIVVNWL